MVVLAQEQARLLNHNYIGTEHLLLGLINEQDGVAARALEHLGISLEAVRAKVEAIIGEGGPGAPSGRIPFTPRSKKVLELSLREALQLGHNYIGTEHILLGLIREGEGVGAQVLLGLGAEPSAVREAVIQLMSGYSGASPSRVRWRPGGAQRPQQTPAAARASAEAHRLAGGGAVGSQHYLLGLLQDQQSLAAKVLSSLGVTSETIEAKLTEMEPAGTSDETPEQAGARRIGMRVEGKLIMLEIDDPELAESLESAMVGRKVRIIRGTDPEAEAAGFANLWSAVSRSVDDVTRRLSRMTGGRAAPMAPWPPAGGPSTNVEYRIVNQADGPRGSLELMPGVDPAAVRAWLRTWLLQWRDSGLPHPGGAEGPTDYAVLSFAIDTVGDSFAMSSFLLGSDGPPGATPAALDLLVQAAISDLSAPG